MRRRCELRNGPFEPIGECQVRKARDSLGILLNVECVMTEMSLICSLVGAMSHSLVADVAYLVR